MVLLQISRCFFFEFPFGLRIKSETNTKLKFTSIFYIHRLCWFLTRDSFIFLSVITQFCQIITLLILPTQLLHILYSNTESISFHVNLCWFFFLLPSTSTFLNFVWMCPHIFFPPLPLSELSNICSHLYFSLQHNKYVNSSVNCIIHVGSKLNAWE